MSQNITFNGNGYVIPDLGEINWGQNLTDFFVSIPAGALQPTGGGFTLTAEVDFGGAFGLKSIYYKSRTTNPAAAGAVRLANTDTVSFRNAGNTADLTLGVNGSNQLTFNGVVLESDTLPSGDMFVGNASNSSTARTISGAWTMDNVGVATLSPNYIVNSMINAAAAIAYSKLNLTGSIVNADINASAAIAYSKLNLVGSIVNADVNASAAIAYSKLNLVGSIVNADINASAAIAFSKMAALTASRMLVSSSGGVVTPSTWSYDATDNLVTGANDELRFQDSTGGEYVAFRAPTAVTTHSYDLPIAAGTAGQVLSWQTGGQLTWINAAGGGTINSGLAGFFTYYPANGTTVDDQAILSTDGTNLSVASGQVIYPSGTVSTPPITFAGDLTTGIWRGGAGRVDIAASGVNTVTFSSTSIDSLVKMQFPDGTALLPSLTFTNDLNTGLFLSAADEIGLSTGGTVRLTIASSQVSPSVVIRGIDGTAAAPSYSFSSEAGLGWYRSGSSRMGLAFGTVEAAFFDGVTGVFGLKNNYNIQTNVGTVALPGYAFNGDADTGMYRVSANAIGFSTGGVAQLIIESGQVSLDGTTRLFIRDGSAASPSLSFGNDQDTGIYLGGVNTLVISAAGSNALIVSDIEVTCGTGRVLQIQDGSAGSPGIRFNSDQDTGLYRIGANHFGFSTAGTLRWQITDIGAFAVLGGANNQILASAGTVSAPAYSFNVSGATDTGIYQTGTGSIRFSSDGVNVISIVGSGLEIGLDGSAASPAINWGNDPDTGFYTAGSANTLRATCGGVQQFRLDTTGLYVVNQYFGKNGTVASPTYSFDLDTDTGFFRGATGRIDVVGDGVINAFHHPVGTSDATQYNPFQIRGGGGGNAGLVSFDNRTTTAVSTTATVIHFSSFGDGNFVVVQGKSGSAQFCDLLNYTYATTNPTVVSSHSTGGAVARTYTQTTAGEIKLAMASGTYDIHTFGLGVATR